MIRGTRAVYVDYVDYDEVAHHAGCLRPESLAALDRLDHVLACLEEVAAAAPRPYRLVILSDHGQSQGAIFADRYGVDLAAVCGQPDRGTGRSRRAAGRGLGPPERTPGRSVRE